MAKKLLYLPKREELNFDKYTSSEMRRILSRRNYTSKIRIEPEVAATVFYLMASSFNLRQLFLNYERTRVKNILLNSRKFSDAISRFSKAIGVRIVYSYTSGGGESISISFKDAVLNMIDVPPEFTLRRGVFYLNELMVGDKVREIAVNLVIEVYISIIENLLNINRAKIIQEYSNEVTIGVLKTYRTKEVRSTVKPPCIQRIEEGDISVGERNNALFALLNYYKWRKIYIENAANFDEIEEILRDVNSRLPEPLPDREINSMIKYHLYGSGAGRIYFYCSIIRKKVPRLCPFGSREECLSRLKKQNSKDRNETESD